MSASGPRAPLAATQEVIELGGEGPVELTEDGVFGVGLVAAAEIEEVLVIGQRPPAQEESKPTRITYEWVSDTDPDNYGLVIRLSRNTNWPIRLYMNSDPGFIR